MMTKKNVIPFMIGLLVGLLIIGLAFLYLDKMGASKLTTSQKTTKYAPLKLGWGDSVGKLNLDSIKPFIAAENIKIITFIDENGGFLVANTLGEEISGWCRMEGTNVGDACSKIKDGSRLVHFNEMTTFMTQASPYRYYMKIDGYTICIDLVTGQLCQ
jgi:hypothetical protein